jgi:O-antigen/teichoic acid export membrane protein
MQQGAQVSILRRAGPLMLARLGVAAVTFAIPMVLARVLLPASYGTFKQAWLLSNTLFLVLPLGLTQSLVYFVPREPLLKRAWITHALALTTALGALAALVLLTAGKLVSEILQLGIAEHDARDDAAGALRLFREAVARLSFVFLPTMVLVWIVASPLIRFLFTDSYLGAVPIFRLAAVSIPMAALPLDGVMRARAQNKFMFRVSALKLALTVPLAVLGLRLLGPIGALGGWICAEESCRMIVLARACRLFGAGMIQVLPRELWFQALAALLAALPGALALHLTRGPLLAQLIVCGLVYAAAYLAALRAMGQLPPVREWLPRRAAMEAAVAR